ncbi:hypothetical protein Q3G72_017145 [Acer saccharum]|nr:hypothetical protein Q3G72_017145 [Acer saccharum]
MDSINSFKGYGKVNELEERAFRRKTRKRIIILVVSSIVLLAVVIGAVVGVVVKNKNNPTSYSGPATISQSLKAVCNSTQYPDSCYSSIASLEASNNNTHDPELIFKLSLQVAINELTKIHDYPTKLMDQTNDERVKAALTVCRTVFDDALDHLNDSMSSMQQGEKLLSPSKIDDIKTWLSSSITDQQTCLDSFEELDLNATNSSVYSEIETAMKNSTEFSSNCLAIGTKIMGLLSQFDIPLHRRLLGFDHQGSSDFPRWVGPGERRLLQEVKPTPDVVVSQDGNGDCKTIKEAVDKVPKKSDKRFVIYIKSGTYNENVILDKSKWNVMMYGDGKTATIISGDKNFGVDKIPTFDTATVAVAGRGFIAKDIKFINTAGAEKHQAVAFRPWKDYSTTIIMQSAIGPFLNPLGWKEWVSNVDPPKTIFYAEYQNTGPGSDVSNRVKWAGYKPTLTVDEAAKFTVKSLIQGSDWLPATSVAFQESL